ncbi:MAG: ferritin family protein, partial [Planctomycetota bacterium]
MMDFDTFEDVLDFAILQEKAAQQFYIKLAGEVLDADVQLFYRTLVEEEQIHEKKLRELKRYEYDLNEPDLEALKDSGYLDAMPIPPDISLAD